MTLDGKLSTKAFTPSRFTSASDKKRLREIRAGADAVLVGRGTVATDTMSLGLSSRPLQRKRIAEGAPPEPLRVILSNRGRLDPSWKVFSRAGRQPVVLSTTRMAVADRARLAPVCELVLFEASAVPLNKALEFLWGEYGVRRLVCEGGPTLFGALAQAGLIDEIFVTIAPAVFGGFSAPTFSGLPGPFLRHPQHFSLQSHEVLGNECYARFVRKES